MKVIKDFYQESQGTIWPRLSCMSIAMFARQRMRWGGVGLWRERDASVTTNALHRFKNDRTWVRSEQRGGERNLQFGGRPGIDACAASCTLLTS